MFSKVAQKVNIYLGNTSEKFVTQNFQKSPNLVTLDREWKVNEIVFNIPLQSLLIAIIILQSPMAVFFFLSFVLSRQPSTASFKTRDT